MRRRRDLGEDRGSESQKQWSLHHHLSMSEGEEWKRKKISILHKSKISPVPLNLQKIELMCKGKLYVGGKMWAKMTSRPGCWHSLHIFSGRKENLCILQQKSLHEDLDYHVHNKSTCFGDGQLRFNICQANWKSCISSSSWRCFTFTYEWRPRVRERDFLKGHALFLSFPRCLPAFVCTIEPRTSVMPRTRVNPFFFQHPRSTFGNNMFLILLSFLRTLHSIALEKERLETKVVSRDAGCIRTWETVAGSWKFFLSGQKEGILF